MADGSVHAGDSVIVGVVGGVWLADKGTPLPACIAFSLGAIVGGVFLSPDLDQDGKTKTETLMERLPLFGTLWFMFWYPYARAIKHRHWTSHAPVIGTIGRLSYMLLLCSPLWYILFYKWGLTVPAFPWWGSWAIAGLMLSDGFHWLRDGFFSRAVGRKRFFIEEKLAWV